MKTNLLAILCVSVFSITKAFAQPCSLTNLQFENVYTGVDGKGYADITFDLDNNNGNKFIYIHIWTAADFSKVDKQKFRNGSGPDFTDINGKSTNPHPALATIAIDNNTVSAPQWSAYNYRPDASVTTVKGASLHLSGAPVSGSGSAAMYRYFVKAVPLGNVISGFSVSNLGMLIWSTQSNATNSHIHCSTTGTANPQSSLVINGSASCATARYTLNVTNTTGNVISGSIDLYADNGIIPNNEVFQPSADARFDAITYFQIEPNQTIVISRSIPAMYLGYNLFSQVMLSNYNTQVQQISTSSCGTLPVRLQSFSANRNQQNVVVKWQTASEQNVRGFNILRQTATNEWQVIAYLPSKAAGGFSSQTLSYQHTDLNAFKGISHYRLEEVDSDGKTVLSEVKMVRGEDQSAKLSVFPNPSSSGKTMVVFDHASVRDIRILDMSGRTVKQLTGITSTNVMIDHLKNGFYTIQVIDRMTTEITSERVLVQF